MHGSSICLLSLLWYAEAADVQAMLQHQDMMLQQYDAKPTRQGVDMRGKR